MKELTKRSIKFIIKNKHNIILAVISLATNIEHLTKNWFYFLMTIIVAILTVWLNVDNTKLTNRSKINTRKLKATIFMGDYKITQEVHSNVYGSIFKVTNLHTNQNHYLFSHRRKRRNKNAT